MSVRGSAGGNTSRSLRPAYVAGRGTRPCKALFPTGKSVDVRATRARNYPGLGGQAPRTWSFYQALLELDAGLSVVDVGSGAGEGCLLLKSHFKQVIGLEQDETALTFAREYAPGLDFRAANAERDLPIEASDVVLFIDVLAHLEQPERALINARDKLARGGRIWIAEPSAIAGQRLRAPQRRGFSKRALTALLQRCGLSPLHWLCDDEAFIAVWAEPCFSSASLQLLSATRALWAASTQQAHAQLSACQRQDYDTQRAYEATLQLAELERLGGKNEHAAQLLLQAREQDRADPRVWAALGRLALDAEDVDMAVRCGVEALEQEPCDASATRLLAEALQAIDHPETIRAWGNASRAAPADLEVAGRLAKVCAANGDYQTGIAALERARDYQTPDAEFHVVLGWLMLLDGRPVEAAHQARAAWARAPGSAAALELKYALQEANAESRIEA